MLREEVLHLQEFDGHKLSVVALRLDRKTPHVRIVQYEMRRICMLDVIIILVTIVTFVAFIGFTEGCERL